MNIWDVLKIEQTKDKDALKKAYRMRLSSVNPEDNPEGFMELRKAYEEAVRLADQSEETPSEKSKKMSTEEQDALSDIYNHFERRINPDCWQALFDTDFYVALDTCEDALDDLMHFLLEHVFLPQKVWKVIVDRFDIAENKRELAERIPENFLDYILNNAKYDDIINYELFDLQGNETPQQIDDYIRDYIELDRLIRAHNKEEAEKKYIYIRDAYSFKNQYLTLCALRIRLQFCHDAFADKIEAMSEEEKEHSDLDNLYAETNADELQSIFVDAIKLTEAAPEDITILLFCGDIAITRQEYVQAKEFYDRAKSLDTDNYFVRVKQAEIAFRTGLYKESRDLFMDLLKENHYDDNVRIGMVRANQKMIEQNRKRLKEYPDDLKAKMEIGWSYYQSYQFQEAIDFLKTVTPDQETKFEYYNVLGRCYLGNADYKNARECFHTWENLIESIPENDESENAQKKRKRYPYVNFLLSDCYMKLKDYTQAEQYLKKALSTEHEEIILSYEALCELSYLQGKYAYCLKACEFLIDKEPQDYVGYLFKAKACRELNYIQDTYNSCERAIHLYPYLAQPYAIETEIFLDARQYEDAQATIRRFDAMKNGSDWIDYCRARLYFGKGNVQQAVQTLAKIVAQSNLKLTDMDHFEDVTMLLGICYKQTGMYKEALQQFIKTRELNDRTSLVNYYIGSMYLKLGELNKSITYLDVQIKKSPIAQAYSDRGTAYFILQDYNHAMSDYLMLLKLEPENAFAYMQIGRIHEAGNSFKAAADAYQKVYTLAPDNDKLLQDCMQFLARVYQCMNWFTESRKLYETYRERFEWNADIAYDYAVLLVRIGDVKTAISMLQPFIDDPACARKLIEIYGDEEYIDLAHETFEYIISKDEKDILTYGVMGDVFRKNGLYEDAKNLYEKAIELDTQKEANYYSEWLECMLKLKPLRSIKKYLPFATIAKDRMNTPFAYIKSSRISRLTKDYATAFTLLRQALKVPRCKGCFYSVCHRVIYEQAVLYEKQRNYAMARSMYEEAINICGQNAFYEACLKRIDDKIKK